MRGVGTAPQDRPPRDFSSLAWPAIPGELPLSRDRFRFTGHKDYALRREPGQQILRCRPLRVVRGLKLRRRQVCESRVDALMVVDILQERADVPAGVGVVPVVFQLDAVLLDRAKPRVIADVGQKQAQDTIDKLLFDGYAPPSARRVLVDKCHLGKIGLQDSVCVEEDHAIHCSAVTGDGRRLEVNWGISDDCFCPYSLDAPFCRDPNPIWVALPKGDRSGSDPCEGRGWRTGEHPP